jgi:S-DNA-T family DNA segregation ATPase FtsK/SpoIIIE
MIYLTCIKIKNSIFSYGGMFVAARKVQKKNVSARKKLPKGKNPAWLINEVTGLIIVAFGILVGLDVFFKNSAGPLGQLLGKYTGGFFGLMGYAVPPLMIILGFIRIFNPRSLDENKRFMLLFLLLALLSAMFQAGLHDISYYENMNLFQYIEVFFKEGAAAIGKGQEFVASGGILGGIIGVPLLFVFRKWGAMTVLITLSIIVALMITRLSLAKAARNMAKGTSAAINGVVSTARKRRIERNIKKSLKVLAIDKTNNKADVNEAGSEAAAAKPSPKIIDFKIDPKPGENLSFVQNTNDTGLKSSDALMQKPAVKVSENTVLNNESVDIANRDLNRNRNSNIIDITVNNQNESPADINGISAISLGKENDTYIFPPLELLSRSKSSDRNMNRIRAQASENSKKLENTLKSFGIGVRVVNISVGPAFTRYELQPAPGIKVSRIVNLTDDIALNLAATGVRIEAPIPGKAAIGIEIPNKEVAPIALRSVLESDKFKSHPSKLAVALGKDITGENIVVDLSQMPHILIAGATGSGKSVCINSFIMSILYKASPSDVKLLMIDPKVVELGVYNGIPHLLIPVVTDPNKAAGALRWAVVEMTTRYKLFAEKGVRDILGYNATVEETGEGTKLPEIVIIIDELSDLMMVAPNDVEDSICRLAQMARAAGMHLVIATQRPSVNVITGVIKANIPSRISFAVSSQVDSRTILDMSGAEKLLGKGDMLYYPVGIPKPIRVKGAFVTDKEVETVVDFIKNQARAHYDQEILENINESAKSDNGNSSNDDCDELLDAAIEAVIDCGQASVSFIQRKFKVGYARAGRIIDQMAERNIISGYEGSKPRRVLISRERWEEMKLNNDTVSGDKI